MLKLKLRYFGHLMQRLDSLGKTLMLGGIGGRRRRGRQRMRWLDGITDSMDMSLSELREWWTGRPGMLQFMGLQRVDMTERLNWTELKSTFILIKLFICIFLSITHNLVIDFLFNLKIIDFLKENKIIWSLWMVIEALWTLVSLSIIELVKVRL